MKINKLIFMVLCALCVSSCTDSEGFLDKKEILTLNEDKVFTDSLYSMQFLADIYFDSNLCRKSGINTSADELYQKNYTSNELANATLTATKRGRDMDQLWNVPYKNIRKVNILLRNLERIPLTEATKTRVEGEARFLRAWYYFLMMRTYSGVPIVYDKVFDYTEDINLERSSFEDLVNYITEQCDLAAGLLPVRMEDQQLDYGRVTRGACLALKALTHLYAASPLFNGGSIDPLKNPVYGYPNEDIERWKTAAEAAEAVIDLDVYDLYVDNQTEEGYGFYELFTKRWGARSVNDKSEYIFQYMQGNNSDLESVYDMSSRQKAGGACNSYPTQEFVDLFGMKDGTPFDWNNPEHAANPYANRDPRLYNSVLMNGSMRYDNTQRKEVPVDLTAGTVDGEDTPTGYFVFKMLNRTVTAGNGGSSPRCFAMIRYADILLAAAESWNEYHINDAVAPDRSYELIKQIRMRAGITPGEDFMYGLKENMSPLEMREIIRNERAVELAYESSRMWDVRRWKIAEQTENRMMHGIKIEKNAANELKYSFVEIQKWTFANRLYLYPIPAPEITKMSAMIQNPEY